MILLDRSARDAEKSGQFHFGEKSARAIGRLPARRREIPVPANRVLRGFIYFHWVKVPRPDDLEVLVLHRVIAGRILPLVQ